MTVFVPEHSPPQYLFAKQTGANVKFTEFKLSAVEVHSYVV